MNKRCSPNERKGESVAKLVSRAKKLLRRASDSLKREPERISTTQLVNLMNNVYKTQKIMTQLEDDTDKLLRKLLSKDDNKR